MHPNLGIKFKEEIDRMLKSSIIKPLKESKWVSPMVINIKKYGQIRICVDYKELNVVCVIDPFPTPFTKEILEGIVGHKIYYFIDGFFGYHQVRI